MVPSLFTDIREKLFIVLLHAPLPNLCVSHISVSKLQDAKDPFLLPALLVPKANI